MTRRAGARAVTYPVQAICLEERRALYWSDRERAWCHMDGWPCPALEGVSGACLPPSPRLPSARRSASEQHGQLTLFTAEECS